MEFNKKAESYLGLLTKLFSIKTTHKMVPEFMVLIMSNILHIILVVISKVKLATIVEGDPKAPFSIATTPRWRGGRYSIPWIAPLYPWTVPYNAEC